MNKKKVSQSDPFPEKGNLAVGRGENEGLGTKHFPALLGRIGCMWKTFFQRWWVINRLHAFSLVKKGVVWVDENEFITYMRELVTDKSVRNQITNPLYFSYALLFEVKDDLLLHQKLKNLIDECSDSSEGVSLIVFRHTDKNDPTVGHSLRLSSSGRERYSWTYIVFGTDSSKKIMTGVLVGLILLYLGYLVDRVKNVVPPVIQVHIGALQQPVVQ